MRIISGTYGGRKLEVPKGRNIRPTSDKIRESIFNALQSHIDLHGAHVLDVFCGTGALGLEALSRGAEHCTFIDKSKDSLALAKRNAENLLSFPAPPPDLPPAGGGKRGFDPLGSLPAVGGGANRKCAFLLKDATKPGPRPENTLPTKLVFLDPPYEKGLILPAINALRTSNWLAPGCVLVLEAEKGFTLTDNDFEILTQKIYGDTKILFLWNG